MRWRFVLSVAVFAVLGALLLLHLGDLSELERTLRQGAPGWIGLAFGVQVLGLFNGAALYWALYKLLELPASYAQLLPLSLASQFVNFTTPSSGLGGTVVFLADARRRGLNGGKVVLVSLLYSFFNLVWFSLLLALGLVLLFLRHALEVYQVVGAALLFGTTLALLAALVLAGLRPDWLQRLGVG